MCVLPFSAIVSAPAIELLFEPPEPGQDPRHGDTIDPLWNPFDFTPEGCGDDWYPDLSYS
jgi:predicted dithiol-disulfide oxidoreductase (DUF899 family)